jgi:hypothetical protein
MNIPSNITVGLPSIILENNSSNNAIWGQIFGTIANQTDLIELINNGSQRLFKIKDITLTFPPITSNTITISLEDIIHEDDQIIKINDIVYGIIEYTSIDYYILASVITVTDTTVTVNIENSIKQIDYVHDPTYVHTDNNYTTTDKNKLAGIDSGAQVNVQSDWTSTTGDSQILNKPTIGNATITLQKNNSNVGQFAVNQTADQYININITKSDVGLNNVDNTKDVDKPVSTATQTQLNNINYDINDIKELIPLATTSTNPLVNKSQLNGIVGDGTITFQLNGVDVDTITTNQSTNKSINYPMNKTAIGLDKVQNLAPSDYPISSAQQTEFNAIYNDITDLQNTKADTSNTYTEAQVDALLDAKSDKSTTYTKSEVDYNLVEKADKSYTYDKSNIDNYLAQKANKFNIRMATQDFNLLEAKLYTITDADILKVNQTATISFNFDDWAEYSYYDPQLDIYYLTLLEWEEQSDLDTYILTLYTPLKGNIPLYQYVKSTDTYTLIYGDTSIELLHPLGIRTGGQISSNLSSYIKGQSASQTLLNMDLIDLYQHIKSINYSTDDSLNDIYNNIDEHTNQLASMYTNAQIDAKDATVKSYTDNTFQPLSAKDSTIPLTPAEDHYPTTAAIKSYVDNLINESSTYRGIIQWCSNSGLEHGDPAPTGAIYGDRVFDIANHNYFIVDQEDTLILDSPLEVGNGYFYDISHFVWNADQSGVIKYSTVSNSWEYTINNNSGADGITIEVNASNNYQLKSNGVTNEKIADQAITSSKIDEDFLLKIENVQSDWNQTDKDADDYIHNKPTIPTIPGVATTSANGLMSFADKNKLIAIPLQFYSMAPSYIDKETVNRITSNNGTWTATATGYAVCYVSAAAAVSAPASVVTQHNIIITVNDIIVDSSGTHLVVATAHNIGFYRTATIPVSKGDKVKISLQGQNTSLTEISCYFIPPKFITYNYYGDEI